MTADELSLWDRYRGGDKSVREEIALYYLPIVILLAKKFARMTRADWEDFRQEGVIGLIKAINKFDPRQGVPFKVFAKPYIRGAILDSSEYTRDIARRQENLYRKVMRIEAELMQTLQHSPTIEEVAGKADVTVEQIHNAIEAIGIAFADELPDIEVMSVSSLIETPQPERTLFLEEMFARLNLREQEVIRLYYGEGQRSEEIARQLELNVSNIDKIRQRAIDKLRQLFNK